MAKSDNKEIKGKVNVMNDAWVEGAAAVNFSGIKQSDFQASIEAAAAKDAAIADLESQLKMKRDERDDDYKSLGQQRSRIGLAVAGDPAFGNDSPLYGAMGFVRKSEKKSGLTRKKKPTT